MAARLAHLNALRAFEATARLGSYVRAASELAVTPAAVGQQVRMLEEHFGSALFARQGNKLVLTEAARAVLPDIKDGFDRLAQATDRLRKTSRVDAVTITLPPSLTKWLIPRIESFSMAHPEVDLRLEPADRLADLLREDITLAIRYGTGRYPGLHATLLMTDEVFPVCSPSLLTRLRKLREPDDLAHFKLIHDTSMDSHAGFPTWTTWLKAAGARGVDAHHHRADAIAVDPDRLQSQPEVAARDAPVGIEPFRDAVDRRLSRHQSAESAPPRRDLGRRTRARRGGGATAALAADCVLRILSY